MAPPPNLAALLLQFRFPSMRQGESEVTRAFLRARGEDYDRFVFDLPLGVGNAPDVPLPTFLENNTRIRGQHHADIVGFRGDVVEIIEAKQRALLDSVGQGVCEGLRARSGTEAGAFGRETSGIEPRLSLLALAQLRNSLGVELSQTLDPPLINRASFFALRKPGSLFVLERDLACNWQTLQVVPVDGTQFDIEGSNRG